MIFLNTSNNSNF